MYGALTCGTCRACHEGRDNLCENVADVMGFHADGFARELVNHPARLTIKVPQGTYRLEVELRPGEVVAKQPDETRIQKSDLDPRRDFTIAVKRPAS